MAALERAILELSEPLAGSDLDAGWDSPTRGDFLGWMQDLRSRALGGEDVRDKCMSIARSLDASAIDSGRLYDAVIQVQRAWRDSA